MTPDRGERSASHLSLYPKEEAPMYLLYRRLGEPQSWSGLYGNKKNLLPLLGIEPIVQPAYCHYID
jgi:hypothetical protein